jgi:hypothetical protein
MRGEKMGDDNYLCEKFTPYISSAAVGKHIGGEDSNRRLEEIAKKHPEYHGEVKVSNSSFYNVHNTSRNLYR